MCEHLMRCKMLCGQKKCLNKKLKKKKNCSAIDDESNRL